MSNTNMFAANRQNAMGGNNYYGGGGYNASANNQASNSMNIFGNGNQTQN